MKPLLMILAIVSALLMTACNTMEGMGKDIERAGEEIQDAS